MKTLVMIAAIGFAGNLAACKRDRPGPTVEDIKEQPTKCYGREVTLTGEVDEVFGPRAFEHQRSHRRQDQQVYDRVRASLERTLPPQNMSFRIAVGGGVVLLSGRVDSVQIREAAATAVKSVPGVRGLANELTVSTR